MNELPDDFIVFSQYSKPRRLTRTLADGFDLWLRSDGEWQWDDSVCEDTARRWFDEPDALVAVVVRDDSKEVTL